eukprot:534635-Pyramimonas_sp.AAC.1
MSQAKYAGPPRAQRSKDHTSENISGEHLMSKLSENVPDHTPRTVNPQMSNTYAGARRVVLKTWLLLGSGRD